MTLRRLLGIGFIFACTAVAWVILGSTVMVRTEESDGLLHGDIEKLWGGKHVQPAPTAWYEQTRLVHREVSEPDASGKSVTRTVTESVVDRVPVSLASSRIDVRLELDLRRKGLLWYDTYAVGFAGRYVIANDTDAPRKIHVAFAFPSRDGIYDGFHFSAGGQASPAATDLSAGVTTVIELAPHETAPIELRYRSRGLDDWRYSFGDGVSQIRDFELVAHTDFRQIDYPVGTMSPGLRDREGDGWKLTWRFETVVTGQQIGIDMPTRMNPGPLAARISFFAPVGLGFFVMMMVILGILRGRSLHPMNYLFISAGFFAFHLVLAYLVDHLEIHASFAIAAAVSVGLVVSYLRLVAGRRFVIVEAAIAQAIFLVMFSYAFFFEGYTGLTITGGAVLTLFVLMQVTGRIDWATALARGSGAVRPPHEPDRGFASASAPAGGEPRA
jgi:hypothetical protein